MESKPLLQDPQPPPMSQPPPAYQEATPPNPYYGSSPPPQQQQPYPQPLPYQPGAPPPPHQPPVVIHQHNVITSIKLGEIPVQMRCPSCSQDIVTSLRYEAGMLTFLLVAVLFFVGFALCCWIPLLMDSCKDVIHVCPHCRCTVGVYKRIG